MSSKSIKSDHVDLKALCKRIVSHMFSIEFELRTMVFPELIGLCNLTKHENDVNDNEP